MIIKRKVVNSVLRNMPLLLYVTLSFGCQDETENWRGLRKCHSLTETIIDGKNYVQFKAGTVVRVPTDKNEIIEIYARKRLEQQQGFKNITELFFYLRRNTASCFTTIHESGTITFSFRAGEQIAVENSSIFGCSGFILNDTLNNSSFTAEKFSTLLLSSIEIEIGDETCKGELNEMLQYKLLDAMQCMHAY